MRVCDFITREEGTRDQSKQEERASLAMRRIGDQTWTHVQTKTILQRVCNP
jgi:hypothetical protein